MRGTGSASTACRTTAARSRSSGTARQALRPRRRPGHFRRRPAKSPARRSTRTSHRQICRPIRNPRKLGTLVRRTRREWTEALPIGNGRLGAMVFGGVERERLQFNEDTLWTGGPHSYAHPGAAKYLPEIRRLLFGGQAARGRRAGDATTSCRVPLAADGLSAVRRRGARVRRSRRHVEGLSPLARPRHGDRHDHVPSRTASPTLDKRSPAIPTARSSIAAHERQADATCIRRQAHQPARRCRSRAARRPHARC